MHREYHDNNPPTLLILSNLNDPAAVRHLHREQSGWRGFANVVELDTGHAVLIIRPGGARELAR
jgi:hypothetical protein